MQELKRYVDVIRATARVMRMSHSGMSPKRDWYLALASASLVGFVLMGFGVFQYGVTQTLISEGKEEGGANVTEAPDVESVARVLGMYRERVALFERLRTEPPIAPSVGVEEVMQETPGDEAEATTTQSMPSEM